MIVFLYGPDSLRRLERKNFYTSQFQKKYSLPVQRIDLAEEDGWAHLEERAKSRSLFEARKLIVLENAFEAEPKKLKALLEFFMESKEANLLITADKKPAKALELLLKKPVVAEEFAELKGLDFQKFLKSEAVKSGAELEPAALAFLAEAYAGDSWGAVTELKKIAGLQKTVTVKDLEALGVETAGDYWALVNGVRTPRIGSRLAALQTVFAMQEPAAKVFNILASLWSQRIKDFAEYDKAIKFGRMDYEEALLDLVLS